MNFEKTDTHSDVTLFKMFVCLSISVLIVRVRNKLTGGEFKRWCNNTFTRWCLKCRQGKYMPNFVPSQASIFGLA